MSNLRLLLQSGTISRIYRTIQTASTISNGNQRFVSTVCIRPYLHPIEQLNLPTCSRTNSSLLGAFHYQNNFLNTYQRRFKKSKGGKSRKRNPNDTDEEQSDDEDDDDDVEENPLLEASGGESLSEDYEEKKIEVVSLRLDTVSCAAFGKGRATLEEAFYKKSLLLNGKVPPKKSTELEIGDEVVWNIGIDHSGSLRTAKFMLISMGDLGTNKGRIRLVIHKSKKIEKEE